MPLAVVTGCNKGVGYYIAQRLRAAGIDVIAACRNPELGKVAAKELDATYEPLDLSSDSSIDTFAETMKTKYGKLDILVITPHTIAPQFVLLNDPLVAGK